MPLTFNGNAISAITFNGNEVKKVTYNGNTVWENKPLSYVCFESTGNYTITFNSYYSILSSGGFIEYSYDMDTWTKTSGSISSPSTSSHKVYIRGTGVKEVGMITPNPSNNQTVIISGNVETMLDYNSVKSGIQPTMNSDCFNSTFANHYFVSRLELPSTNLSSYCYAFMFSESQTDTLPKLPATTIPREAYNCMFMDCVNIKVSTTKTGAYQYAYRIPTSGTGSVGSNALTGMFDSTGGTFTGKPSVNTTYYTTKEPIG